MDMNELLRQHQIALINEQHNQSGSTHSNSWMVGYYEKRIKRVRCSLGVAQY